MNKQKFLKQLEAKLMILDDMERKDILDEYSATIDDKISHGKDEKTAIADFGSIDELASEILAAYKINPKFKNPKAVVEDDDIKNFLTAADTLIKKGAQKATDFYEEVVEKINKSDKKVTVENIFEIVFKVMIVLFILIMPFQLFNHITMTIASGLLFYPLNIIVRVILGLTGALLYFLLAYIIVTRIINDVLGTNIAKKDTVKEKVSKPEKKAKAKTAKEEVKKDVVVVKTSGATNIIYAILKVVIFVWSLPLIGVLIAMYFGLTILVYFMYKGLFLIGFTILLLGLISLFTYILNTVYKITITKKKIHVYPIIGAMLLILFGSIMSIDYVYNLDYIDNLPTSVFETKTYVKELTITKSMVYFPQVKESDLIIDDTLLDNQVIIELKYYAGFSTYYILVDNSGSTCELDAEVCNMMYVDRHRVYIKSTENEDTALTFSLKFIEGLKDHKVYSPRNLFDLDVTIRVNSNTRAKITFENTLVQGGLPD